MLAVNIKLCIANFSTEYPSKKVEGSEIVRLKIFRSNSQASMIFITYTLLKCVLPNKTMQLILYEDGCFTCSVKVWATSFV